MLFIGSLVAAILFILISYKILLGKNSINNKSPVKNTNQDFINNSIRSDYDRLLKINKELENSLRKLKKAKDKAVENDRLKSVFLANMSHEIRTPMNAILGFSNLLLKENISEENKKEFARLIIENGNDLLNLINDIIDISKIEAEQLKINITKCNLTELMKDIYLYYNDLIMHDKMHRPEVELKLICDQKGEDTYILSDPHRLRQILSNLINNAIKFTYAGKIEFGFKNSYNNKIKFFVKDTGIGISRDKLDSIFERFKQVEDPYTKKYNGSGLGLSIAKQLVELLGGNIWVESKEGTGSSFYFTIPSGYKSTEKLKDDDTIDGSSHDYNWKDKVILIAEDEKANFIYLNTILSKSNARIYWAVDGAVAVRLCKKKHIDLVLMDIKMQGMNGYEATKKIKSMNPDIPVIAQTAYAMSDDIEKLMKAGCNDYITKPIKINELLPLINKNFQKFRSTA
jgi:signal transduction histidine kinase/ActR/RegA family two-component response regulator